MIEKTKLRDGDSLRCPYCHDDDFESLVVRPKAQFGQLASNRSKYHLRKEAGNV